MAETWVKLHDKFPEHPKVVAAGHVAGWLYVCGLAYCSRHLTDGVIPKPVVARLSDVRSPARHARTLVEVGLWTDEGDHFRVHDYDEWQRPSERVEEERAKARDRKRRQREREAAKRDVTSDVTRDTSVSHGGVTTPEVEVELPPLPPRDGHGWETPPPEVKAAIRDKLRPHLRAVDEEATA